MAQNILLLLMKGLLIVVLFYGTSAEPPKFNWECWEWSKCISNCSLDLSEEARIFLSKVPTPFVVTSPYQLRKSATSPITSTLGKQDRYFEKTKYWLTFLGPKHIQIKVKRSSILDGPPISVLFYRKREDQIREVESSTIHQCQYTGWVIGSENSSYVALDTCAGLRGIIFYQNVVYGVAPLPCERCSYEPHVVYRETEHNIERNTKLNTFWHPIILADQPTKKKKNPSSGNKLVHIYQIGLIIDQRMFRFFSNDTDKVKQYAARIINLSTKSFNETTIELRLVHVEIWNEGDSIAITSGIKATLNALARYRALAPRRSVRNDAIFLLTRQHFVEAVEYLTIPNSVCTTRAMGVVQVTYPEAEYTVSRLLSLAIAEQFGINSFMCPDLKPCHTTQILSKGDISRIALAIFSGLADCLVEEFNERPPHQEERCGNGVVDWSEECDAVSPCCDEKTCLAAPWAQCVEGGCCNNCTLLPRARICRPALDECDLPEFCTGKTGTCPPQLHLENGQPCKGGESLCYQGRCPTRDSQCQTHWGKGAIAASEECYRNYNYNQGDKQSCSKTKCEEKDVMCGVLHCQGGSSKPTIATTEHFNNNINIGNNKFECKSLGASKDRYVYEGTQCAPNQFCFNNKCISIRGASFSRCPSNPANNLTCSGIGYCTNLGQCLCSLNTTGTACEIPSNITALSPSAEDDEYLRQYIWMYAQGIREDAVEEAENKNATLAGSPAPYVSVMYLIIILLSIIVGCIFTASLVLYFCHKRRTKQSRTPHCRTSGRTSHFTDMHSFGADDGDYPSAGKKKRRKRFHNGGGGSGSGGGGIATEEEELFDETIDRSIKFGNTPSYREDKKNKLLMIDPHHSDSSTRAHSPEVLPQTFLGLHPTAQNHTHPVPMSLPNVMAAPGRGSNDVIPSPNPIQPLYDNDQATVLMENSWRQPEKGILKNKNVQQQYPPENKQVQRRPSNGNNQVKEARMSQSSFSSCGSSMTAASTKPGTPGPLPVILFDASNQTDNGPLQDEPPYANAGEEDDGGEGYVDEDGETDAEFCDNCALCNTSDDHPVAESVCSKYANQGSPYTPAGFTDTASGRPMVHPPHTRSGLVPRTNGPMNPDYRQSPTSSSLGGTGPKNMGSVSGSGSLQERDSPKCSQVVSRQGTLVSSNGSDNGIHAPPTSSVYPSAAPHYPQLPPIMHPGLPQHYPQHHFYPQQYDGSSETGQTSETEVDAHLLAVRGETRGLGNRGDGGPFVAVAPTIPNNSMPLKMVHPDPIPGNNFDPRNYNNVQLSHRGVSPPALPHVPHKHLLDVGGRIGGVEEDAQSGVSGISAFRRGEANDFGPDDRLSEVRSNEGTWEGSDTSSMQDTQCNDLLNLANISASRTNGVNPHRHQAPPIPAHRLGGPLYPVVANNRFEPPSPKLPPPPAGFGGSPAHFTQAPFNPPSTTFYPATTSNFSTFYPNNVITTSTGFTSFFPSPHHQTNDDHALDQDEPSLRRKSYTRATDSYENLLR